VPFGYRHYFSLDEIAQNFGEKDGFKIIQIANYLKQRGWIAAAISSAGAAGHITGMGAVFVEQGGNTGVIAKYRESPQRFFVNIDNSVTIHGGVSQSAVAVHSANVTQTVAIPPDIEGKLEEILQSLRASTTVTQDQLHDITKDIETLRLQLGKKKRDKDLIETTLSTLVKYAPIATQVGELSKVLLPWLAS